MHGGSERIRKQGKLTIFTFCMDNIIEEKRERNKKLLERKRHGYSFY